MASPAIGGVGIGLDLNSVNNAKMPYPYQGKITGFRMSWWARAPAPVRVNFVTKADSSGVAPFIVGTFGAIAGVRDCGRAGAARLGRGQCGRTRG